MTVAPGAKDQVARLLMLVPYLHARETVRLEDAARDLGSTPKQLLRDLKVLLMCGLPGGYPDDLIDVDLDALEEPDGDGVVRVSNADYLARPLRLTPTEASAVIVALRALRNNAGAETREVLDRTLAKLDAAVAQGTAAGLIDPGQEPVDPGTAALAGTLAEAVQAGRQVRLRYFVPSRDEVSERVVDPRGVVEGHGFSYLDGYCHTAQGPRLFRLDRISEAVVLDTPVATPREEPRSLAQGPFPDDDDTVVVTLRLAPEARWVMEYYPLLDARPADPAQPDGAVEAELRVADEQWLTRLLLRLAPYAEVVRPREFTETFSAAAQATLSLYQGRGVG